MIDKNERRKRLIEDFRKMAKITSGNESEMVSFAQNIPDEILDNIEKLYYISEKKMRTRSNLKVVKINYDNISD